MAAADPASLGLTPAGRRSALEAYATEIAPCTRCRLAGGRTQVVFGTGDPDANLMFIGEAPGSRGKQGFVVGQAENPDSAGEIGLAREDVYIAT